MMRDMLIPHREKLASETHFYANQSPEFTYDVGPMLFIPFLFI
jgi:hypothetical protein